MRKKRKKERPKLLRRKTGEANSRFCAFRIKSPKYYSAIVWEREVVEKEEETEEEEDEVEEEEE